MSNTNKRMANFELLRIIAMAMVIVLHYVDKGNIAPKLSSDSSLSNHFWWFVLAVCNVSVNAYVLISGYFLVDSKWHVSKVIKLVAQVLFYSVLVGVVSGYALGLSIGFDSMLAIILPIEYEHYWFATAYIVMYILAPVLAIAVKELPQKQLKTVITCMLLFFCVTKSINPYQIPTDSYGYDFGWFICLFLIAGYIKLYGLKLFSSKSRSILWYVTSVIVNFALCATLAYIVRTTGKLEYYMDMTYAYNFILVLFSSIAFFYIFIHVEIKDGWFSKVICKVAPYTFGVYLLHENIIIRDEWPALLGAGSIQNLGLQTLHLIVCVIVVFACGCVIDAVRKVLFDFVERIITKRGKNAI